MHRYLPNTEKEIKQMMNVIGIDDVENLFSSVPETLKQELNLPRRMTEQELVKHMKSLAKENKSVEGLVCFMGAGVYDHYIPVVIDSLISRSEFYTSYTPYQAEISQGILQAIFEYQTMICELTGMDVANASMYDGATSTAEACAVALAVTKKRKKILISEGMHPETREVIKTYMSGKNVVIEEVMCANGKIDYGMLEKLCDDNTIALCLQTPNFFGMIEDMDKIGSIVKKTGAAFIVNTDPIALGILKAPGEAGADFVVGDAQVMGNPMAFGGPHLGFFAVKREFVHKMPGRVVGETTDINGDRGFVLTLQAREQHIRREKATSNICSNHTLNALAAAIYMTTVGKEGLKEIALRCANNSFYMFNKLIETGKFKKVFDGPFFKEFIVESVVDVDVLNSKLLKFGYLGGYPVKKEYSGIKNGWLVAVTEKRTKEEIDEFVEKAGEAE